MQLVLAKLYGQLNNTMFQKLRGDAQVEGRRGIRKSLLIALVFRYFTVTASRTSSHVPYVLLMKRNEEITLHLTQVYFILIK